MEVPQFAAVVVNAAAYAEPHKKISVKTLGWWDVASMTSTGFRGSQRFKGILNVKA